MSETQTTLSEGQLEYLQVSFPFWMANFPGGLEFDRYASMADTAQLVLSLTENLLKDANEQGLAFTGALRSPDHPNSITHPAWYKLQSNCSGTELRHTRGRWKLTCKKLGLPHGNEMWRKIPQVVDHQYREDWTRFTDAVLALIHARHG
jgi:hypothetical protein